MTPNYNTDWDRLIRDLTPFTRRQPVWLALLAAFIAPVAALHRLLLSFRRAMLEDLMIAPNVRIFRYYLNERYDGQLNRIRVIDGPEGEEVRIFTESENRPIYLPRFLSATPIDFAVILPEELRPIEAEIRRFIERYKLPTKTYIIQYISDTEDEEENPD